MRPAPDHGALDGASPVVLALDTTAAACSVALIAGKAVARRSLPMVQGHSRYVLGLVDAVMSELSVAPEAVDVIGFGSGPGSFTGLRIACGIAQGLGLGWGRPLVAVDSLRTLAMQAAAEAPGETDRVLVALDLRMGEVCFAAFDCAAALSAADWREPVVAATLGSPQAAREAFERVGGASAALAGDGFDAHAVLSEWAVGNGVRPPGAVQPDAWAVARLAASGLRCGRGLDPTQAAPVYLRDKVALDVDEQAALRAARAAAQGGRR